MRDVAVRVENISKLYKIAAVSYRHDSLRDHVTDWVQSLFIRNGYGSPRSAEHSGHDVGQPSGEEHFWALKEVSFEVKKGEVVGIIGRNGSGKSTLLKILSRVIEPTSGFCDIHGRAGSLLEVGTGFHRDLTGRENIYLSGAILGMRKTEIDRRFDEIVDFSGVEKFIDTPVKRYSSGMQVRLAFAVAANLDPEILILDEVLAVGDAEFQEKCLSKMGDVAKSGRTVILVSHNMGSIERLCSRSIWMDRGQVACDGLSSEAIRLYQPKNSDTLCAEWLRTDLEKENDDCSFLSITAKNKNGEVASIFRGDEDIRVELRYILHRRLEPCQVGARLLSSDGVTVLGTEDVDGIAVPTLTREPGLYRTAFNIPANLLRPGKYSFLIGASSFNRKWYELIERAIVFEVSPSGSLASDGRMGIISPRIEWETSSKPAPCSARVLSNG